MNLVDEKARLAGSNKMELLLFSVGGKEVYGINVFKVREVCEMMSITRTPNMPHGYEGIVSLRGSILPVIGLGRCLGIDAAHEAGKLIVTEFSSHTQAFLVEAVDRIVRVDWDKVRAPHGMTAPGSRITAITELSEGKLVSILDVEQILADVMGEDQVPALDQLEGITKSVFFVDDSAIARRKIVEVLERLNVQHQHAINGRDAWEKLESIATTAAKQGKSVAEQFGCILVDAEMPEMDGYVLTRHIKGDGRFEGVPVVMHSSLSSVANRKLGQQVGVDAYVAKFHPEELGKTLAAALARR
jgi:two-component system chemotaxis response regulator CheV